MYVSPWVFGIVFAILTGPFFGRLGVTYPVQTIDTILGGISGLLLGAVASVFLPWAASTCMGWAGFVLASLACARSLRRGMVATQKLERYECERDARDAHQRAAAPSVSRTASR